MDYEDNHPNQFYEKNGYIVVPSALSRDEVSCLRVLLEKTFSQITKGSHQIPKRWLSPSEVLAIPEVYRVPIKEGIVNALKALLGESYTMFADFQVHRNIFGGWHIDSGSEGKALYLIKADYRFVKCGVFLQDNDPVSGEVLGKPHRGGEAYDPAPYYRDVVISCPG